MAGGGPIAAESGTEGPQHSVVQAGNTWYSHTTTHAATVHGVLAYVYRKIRPGTCLAGGPSQW